MGAPRHHAFDGANLIPLNNPSLPICHPVDLRTEGHRLRHIHGRWAYLVLEQLRGRGANGRPWQLQRSTSGHLDHAEAGSRHPEARRTAGLSIELACSRSAARQCGQVGGGARLFRHEAGCATCHQSPNGTDVLSGPDRRVPFLHDPVEVGMDPRYAARTATGKYRTAPLRGLWQHAPYVHDGSAPDLLAVVNHYNQLFGLNLTARQQADLVEFLKSL